MKCHHGMEENQCSFCKRLADLLSKKNRPTGGSRTVRIDGRTALFDKNEDYYIGLGLLASTCFIDAHVPPDKRLAFSAEYYEMTGVMAQDGDAGFTVADPNQWGISMRIYFPRKVVEMLPALDAFSETTNLSTKGTVAINNKAWTYELFGDGFRVGRSHDVASIRSSVPAEFQEAFDVGISMGTETAPTVISQPTADAPTPMPAPIPVAS